jgi:hypothetical protein
MTPVARLSLYDEQDRAVAYSVPVPFIPQPGWLIEYHGKMWEVTSQPQGNASAFNGYRWQPSDYSQVSCTAPGCSNSWRTKAAYVKDLPDGSAR